MIQARPVLTKSLDGRINELDGLRGILALWVVVAHVFCWTGYWSLSLPRPLEKLWSELVGAGAAVDTFMILSGFAISFLLDKQQLSYGKFMLGRVFRIYPVYCVCLFVAFGGTFLTPFVLATASWRDTIYFEWNRLLSVSENSAPSTHLLLHMSLLNGLVPKRILMDASGTILPPAWSITLEWQFYLVAPLLARWSRSARGLLMIVPFGLFGVLLGHAWANPLPAFLPAQLPMFLVGIGSYQFYLTMISNSSRSEYAGIAAAILVLVGLLLNSHSVALCLWAVGFGCIFTKREDAAVPLLTSIRALLLHPWLQWLGQISFPLYLIHWPFILFTLAALLHAEPSISALKAAAFLLSLGLPAMLLLASLIHTWVEKPMIRLGRSVSSRK